MAKKQTEKMQKLEPEFIGKCVARGYDEKSSARSGTLTAFAPTHLTKTAAAYGFVAYQTAFLKAHYIGIHGPRR